MKNRGLILRMFLLIAVLAAIHLTIDFCGEAQPQSRAPTLLDPNVEIAAIEVKRLGDAPVRLRHDGDWRIVSPIAGLADREVVLRLLDALTTQPIKDYFSKQELSKLGRTRTDFKLENPTLTVTVESDSSRKKLFFGGPTPSGEEVFVAVEGTAEVCTVPGEIFPAVDLTLEALRRKSLFRLDPLTVTSFALRDGQGHHRNFVVDAEGWKSEGETATPEAVGKLLNALAKARAQSFVWPRGVSNEQVTASATLLASFGIDPESSPMAILGGNGTGSERIVFGKTEGNGGSVYAMVGNGSAVVTVDKELCALVAGDIGRYFDRRLFPVEPDKVTSLVMEENGCRYALAQGKERGWLLESPVIAPADATNVGKLIGNMLALSKEELVAGGLQVSLGTNSSPVSLSREQLLGTMRFEDLRSLEIIGVDPAKLRRITRTVEGEKPLSLVKSREAQVWRMEAADSKMRVEQKNLEAVLAKLNPLKALRIEKLKAAPTELVGYGLEKPWMIVSVDFDSASELRRNLLVGEKTQGGRFATVGSSEAVFVLAEETLESLLLPLAE